MSLKWLQKQQNKDGSWGGTPQNYKCAMTGLALLSYLANCETPLSADFGETVLKGISFLVDQGVKNPVISLVPQRNEVKMCIRDSFLVVEAVFLAAVLRAAVFLAADASGAPVSNGFFAIKFQVKERIMAPLWLPMVPFAAQTVGSFGQRSLYNKT